MIVLCDTSALSALAELELLELLPQLHPEVTITASVLREGLHPRAPAPLRTWLAHPPAWISIVPDPPENLPETSSLGAGEASSISHAWQLRNHALLIILDDSQARLIAQALGLPITGLIGILGRAAHLGLVDFPLVVAQLATIGFRISPQVIQRVRQQPGLPPDAAS